MRFCIRSVAALWGALQLAACSSPEFHTVDSSLNTGGTASGGAVASGGTGGDVTTGGSASGGAASGGGSNSGGTSSAGASAGGTNSGGSASGGASTGGANSGGTGGIAEPQIPQDGLLLWLRADTGVTLTAGKVGAWQNQAKPGGQAQQTVGSTQPALLEAGLNGKPAIDFDGEDDFLGLPDGAADFSDGLTMFVVLEQDTGTVHTSFLEFSTGSELNDISVGFFQNNLHYEVLAEFMAGPVALIGEPELVTVVHGSEESIELRQNASASVTHGFALPVSVLRTQNFIGKSLYGDSVTFDGRIGEILVYDHGLFPDALADVEAYLEARWF